MTSHTRTAAVLLAVLSCLAGLFVAVSQSAIAIGTDDYPYRTSTPDTVDKWNFYKRECTSFVAWRLNHDNHVPFSNSYRGQHWGNAEHWDTAAAAAGIAVNSTPAKGAVAVFNPGVDGVGSHGHVAYVLSWTSTSILVEDYNWQRFAYDKHTLGRAGVRFIHLGSPGASTPTGVVHTSGAKLTVRSSASTSAAIRGYVANGTTVHITCQRTGTTVKGTYGTSAIWDHITEGNGGYVSDAYVYTGSNSRIAPAC